MGTLFSKRYYKGMKQIAVMLFFVYIVVLGYLLFFASTFGRDATFEQRYNLIPFKTIGNYLKYRDYVDSKTLWINLMGNIIAFIPMGFFVPVLFKKGRGLIKVFLFSAMFSLLMECFQYIFVVGTFDVDDVFLNTWGGMIGFFLFKYVRKTYYFIRKEYRQKNRH